MITFPKSLKQAGPHVGAPVNRVDGLKKVTGRAQYAGEFFDQNLTYGFIVSSTIAKGQIQKIDTTEALKVPGVLQVFTHQNRPPLAWFDRSYRDDDAPSGSPFRPLGGAEILYSGQPIALVVAETFEVARFAATLVAVSYEAASHQTHFLGHRREAREPRTGKGGFQPPPKPRGDADEQLLQAPYKVDAEYLSPPEHHNPMEPHASTVLYQPDGKLIIHDKTQGVQNSQTYVCKVFGLSKDDVRVVSPFIGGAFGSGLRPQHQLFFAVLAARELKRSVRVTLTRQQMFTFGHRPETVHRVALGASPDGRLKAIIHEAVGETSQFEDYIETVVNWSGLMYQCENVRLGYRIVPLDVYTPLDMRAPGASLGIFALETAMDELAYQVGIDPLELRLINYAERDQNNDKDFSSKELKACYSQAAERFGWAKRSAAPRSQRRGHTLIGWGMATGAWEASQMPASAKAAFHRDGRLIVSSGTADIGTGTYTIMTQIAADCLGLPLDAVTFELGDTSQPTAPLQGGSWTASSVGSAVKGVCDALRDKLFKLAHGMKDSPLAQAKAEEVEFQEGQIYLKNDSSARVSLVKALAASGKDVIEQQSTAVPNLIKQHSYTRHAHSAVFVEVEVDEDFGKVKVTRLVTAVAGGRILNPKTARSQIIGGMVWGIGMALEEETLVDHELGRYMNHTLAEYHIPVHADIQDLEVIFVEEHDEIVNPLGAKGLGEIGIVGVAAAISNAVYHATGKRVRDLPITLDKVL